MQENQKQNPGSKSQSFTPQTSTKAIAVVIASLLFGFLLLMVVNSNSDEETASTSETSVPTTTVAPQEEDTDTEEPETTEEIADAKDPSEVNVLVLNGSNAAGIAGGVTEALAELDYQTLTAANDSEKGSGTTIYYKNGFESDAEQLATNVLPGVLSNLSISQEIAVEQFPLSAPTTWDQDDLVAANVVIVVGNA